MLHQFRVKAIDQFGNVGPTTMYEWETIDVTPPDTQLIDMPADPMSSASRARFTFTGTDNAAVIEGELQQLEFECRLNSTDESAFHGCTSPADYINLEPGLNTFEVRAVDEEGNVDPIPAGYAWTVTDGTPPETTLTSKPDDSTVETSANFEYSSSESDSTFTCSLNGADFTACPVDGITYENLPTGGHWFRVAATDSAGHRGPVARELRVEHRGAARHVGSGHDDRHRARRRDRAHERDDRLLRERAGDVVRVLVPTTGSWNVCTSPFQVSNLTVGTYTLSVRAIDLAGNVDETPASITLDRRHAGRHDARPRTAPADPTDATSATFTFTADQENAGFECALDAAIDIDQWTACDSGTVEYSDLALGDHDFAVRARVDAENVDASPATYSWAIGDITERTITITDGPGLESGATVTNEYDATFTFASAPELPAGTVFQCSLDGGLPHPCASGTYTVDAEALALDTGIPSGEHTLLVSAALGPNVLVDPIEAEYVWTILDTAPPTTSIVSTVPERIRYDLEPPMLITFGSNEANATFQCTLEGTDVLGTAVLEEDFICGTPPTNSYLVDLDPGTYTLSVVAIDASENLNLSTTPATVSFDVVGPPITTITATPDLSTADPPFETSATSISFAFAADQTVGISYLCSLDEAGFEPCTSRRDLRRGRPLGRGHRERRSRDRARRPLLPGHRDQRLRSHRGAGRALRVDGRPAAGRRGPRDHGLRPRDDAGRRARQHHDLRHRQPQPARRALLRVLGRRRAVHDLRLAARAQRPRGRHVHGPGGRHRRRRQPRPDSREPHLGSRPAAAAEHGHRHERPGPADPAGRSGGTITFGSVTTAGTTTVDAILTPPAVPTGYLTTGATYFDISTTAVFGEPVTLCVPYSGIADGARLLHHDGTEWVDVTLTDSGTMLCAEVSSLSPFAIVDSTPVVVPVTSIQTAPAASTPSSTAIFAFTSDPLTTELNPVTFECVLDPIAGELLSWSSCEALNIEEGLLLGQHELLVRAVNEVNSLFDASPERHVWTVRAPTATVTDGPDAITTDFFATFEFSTDNPVPTFECRLDVDTLWGSCETPYLLEDIPAGNRTLFVRALNEAGEAGQATAYEWTVSPLPETIIRTNPPAVTNNKTASFTFDSDLAGARFECALDEAVDDEVFTPCVSGITYTNLIFGSHDFAVRAVIGETATT